MPDDLKKRVETEVAQRFLDLFNSKNGTNFTIIEIGESPDVYCSDDKSGQNLNLEITILENIEGDAKEEFERIRGQRLTFSTSQGMRGNFETIFRNLKSLLNKKLQASYKGTPTALVIGRIFTIWSCNDIRNFIGEPIRNLVQGREDHFPDGIWIFCTNDQGTEQDILNLFEI